MVPHLKAPGTLVGRACACERTKRDQAKLDRAKPRCNVLIADHPSHEERCGDHQGHDGEHGQTLINQVMKPSA